MCDAEVSQFHKHLLLMQTGVNIETPLLTLGQERCLQTLMSSSPHLDKAVQHCVQEISSPDTLNIVKFEINVTKIISLSLLMQSFWSRQSIRARNIHITMELAS